MYAWQHVKIKNQNKQSGGDPLFKWATRKQVPSPIGPSILKKSHLQIST